MIRALLCRLLGGHEYHRPVWRNGKARLVCVHGCGHESEGIAMKAPKEPRPPVVTQEPRRDFKVVVGSGRFL